MNQIWQTPSLEKRAQEKGSIGQGWISLIGTENEWAHLWSHPLFCDLFLSLEHSPSLPSPKSLSATHFSEPQSRLMPISWLSARESQKQALWEIVGCRRGEGSPLFYFSCSIYARLLGLPQGLLSFFSINLWDPREIMDLNSAISPWALYSFEKLSLY